MSRNLPAEQKANSFLQKATLIIAKTAEILHWCLVVAMAIIAICSIIWYAPATEWLKTTNFGNGGVLSCYGFEMIITNAGALIGFAAGSAIILSLMAMIFRNVYLILRTADGKTWFTKGNTPFQKNIVRMLREIGIFFIIIAVMGSISSIVVSALGGETNGVNYMSAFIGLVFICISQFFNYGTSLEKDLDGLV